MTTVAELLATRLRSLGVQRVYGDPLADLPHVAVGDPHLAVLLADVDGRLGEPDGRGRLGAAMIAGPILHLSSCPGGTAPLQEVGSAEELLDALVDPPGVELPATTALHLDLDLSAEVPSDLAASVERERSPVLTLDPSMAGLRLVCVVGPGVVRAGALEGLRSFSRTAGVGILNTWGAKGVERWDSPLHFGTAGLQADDLALGGLAEADVVITSGLDPAELPGGSLPHAVVQEVPPGQLGALARGWAPAPLPSARPPLYDALAAVVRPLYESESVPLSAPRAALHLSGALPDRGIAVADPGPAGFWIARTFPTSIPNSVCVPATVAAGFATAAAVVCALEQRPVLAVTDPDGLSAAETEELLDLAASLGLSVALQVWEPDPGVRWMSTADHVQLLADLLERADPAAPPRVVGVPVDLDGIEALEQVAGEVTAWGGLATL